MKENYQRGYIRVDLDAVRNNILNMKKNISDRTGIIAVIKADGYGHGAIPIGKELEELDCIHGFAVATAEEAFILRKSGIHKPLLVLGYTFPYAYEELIKEQIAITVFREDTLEQLSQCAGRLKARAQVHIKVDTGMTRLGIAPDDSGFTYVQKVLDTENLRLEGMFTHFAKADERDKSGAEEQLRQFKQFTERIEKELHYQIPLKHCSNSAGIIEMKDANMDAVRAGISLYGLWPSEEVGKENVQLIPALSFHSQIVMMKEVGAGVPVSYGGTYITKQNTKIATIPVGYGDGYPRSLSNKGYVLIRGQKAPIIGRICMDQFMVDVTDITGACEGDRVTLIGVDGECQLTAEMVGDLSGRFNYELVCDFGKRIPRVYTKGGAIVSSKDYYQDF